ncbi:MAG: DUF3159 domain-containing protein [Candidatus Nanopelagicaceae bacterium]|nr:DUF3159 domain-containing protein [Candidatus Nanopelagicaceae bacterium]
MTEAHDHEADKAKIVNALGGKKGLIDSGLPALVFLVAFNLTKDVKQASYAALGLSLILTLIRLVKRETIQHAISGVIGVVVCFWLANRSGNAEDFYLPGLWTNAIYGVAYVVSILVRWPVIGLIVGPLLEENLRWRKDPARTKVYIKATWLWVGMFAIRLLVQYPLYLAENVNALGTARLIMGYPLFIATAWATWLVIKSGPKLREDLRVNP